MKPSRGVWETLDSLCRALEGSAPSRLVEGGLEHLASLGASDRCSLYVRHGKRALTLVGLRGARDLPERIPCAPETPPDSLMARVLETREPLFIRDIERFRRQSGLRRPPYERANPRSREYDPACVVLPVPGPGDTEPFGILNLSDMRGAPPRRGSSRRSALLHGAALLGMALRTAHRYQELEARASRDGLTGLYNYATFYDLLGSEVLRSERYGSPLSLILLDIDHFKALNDRFGHLGGDEVLAELARRIRTALRAPDLPARYSGDEFAVILPQTPLEGACQVARRIRATIAETPFLYLGTPMPVTVSVGVAELGDGMTAVDLVGRADRQLYCAKDEGRNRVAAPR